MLVRPVMKRLFFPLENQGKKGSLRSRASLLVIGGNEARPQYLQNLICDASWSTGAYSFVGRRSTDSSSSTSWSHDSHVFSNTRTLVVPETFLRVLYKNIHHYVTFARALEEKGKKHRPGPTSSTFHFSFSCGIVYSRGNRTPESEIKQTSVYLIRRKMRKKFHIHTWHTHTTVVVHLSTGGRHQVKMQQTGSEPPNRNPPELLVIRTSHIHKLFCYRRQHSYTLLFWGFCTTSTTI